MFFCRWLYRVLHCSSAAEMISFNSCECFSVSATKFILLTSVVVDISFSFWIFFVWVGRKEDIFLLNDTLNTFYLQLYGVWHKVKDHSDCEETCCRHVGYSFWLAARVLLYAPSHTTAFVTPVVEHWLQQEIAQWVHHEGSIRPFGWGDKLYLVLTPNSWSVFVLGSR